MLVPNKQVELSDIKRAVIANAMAVSGYTLSVGDCIQPGATSHAKFVTGAANSGLILGVVTAIIYKGKIAERTSVLGVNSTSAVAGAGFIGNDNETYGYWSVDYIPAYVPMEYKADVSNTLGTTTNSDGLVWFPLKGVSATAGDAGTLLETGPVLFSSTQDQIMSFGASVESTKKAIVHISKIF